MSTYYGPGTDDISFVPLTKDEEKELFNKFYTGDLSARDELIRRHLKLTAKLALTYAKRAILEEDAISAGNFGLMQCLESRKFNPDLGFRFASYVRSFIKGQVCKAIRERAAFNGVWKEDHERHVSQQPEEDCPNRVPADAAVTGAHANQGGENHAGFQNFNGRLSSRISWERETAVDHEYENLQLTLTRRNAIEAALSKLKKMEAIAIRAVELEGKSHADVAREHKVSRQASQQAWMRGMAKLKELLTPMKSELC
jgi:RNA polymerase sigma factor (sigma-70 family)